MSEIVLEDSLDRQGIHRLHVMSSNPIRAFWRDWVPEHASARREWQDELHLYHLQATWQAQEVVRWTFQTQPVLMQREVVLWAIEAGQKISQAMVAAAECYALHLGRDPQYAFIRRMPAVAEEVEVKGVMLVEAEWMPENFILLDCGGAQKLPEFRVVGWAAHVTEAKQLKLTV
jgi:hypothetical protein